MSNRKIRSRVLLVVLAPLLVAVVALSIHYILSRMHGLERAFNERGQAIVRELAPAAEYGVFSGNATALRKLGEATLREPDVVSVVFSDAEGGVLVRVGTPTAPQSLRPTPGDSPVHTYHASIYASSISIEDYGRSRNSAASESHGDTAHMLGTVDVALSDARMRHEQHHILAEGLLIAVLCLLAATPLALHLANSVTGPIIGLTQTVDAIGGGDLDARAPSGGYGELAHLAEGINTMAGALAKARAVERRQAEDALYLEQVKAQVTLESIGEGVITTDSHGIITYINPVAEQLTGWRRTSATGLELHQVFRLVDKNTRRPLDYPLHRCLRDGETVRHEANIYLSRHDQSEFAVQDAASPIRDRFNNIIGAVIVFHDFTEIERMAELLEHQASHDDLTGLMNRREFERQLAQTLTTAQAQGTEHSLVYLDLDQFKIVNDTCGHIAGDTLLRQLADTLREKIRHGDILARLGGDEFGIILNNCPIADALRIAEYLRSAIRDFRFSWKAHIFEIGVSMGVVPIAPSAGTLPELLSAADSACYIAKDKGRNRIHVFQHDDQDLARRHGEMQWINRLQQALADDRFVLCTQPIVSLTDEHACRDHEILVRMLDTDGSHIKPTAFIPSAERYQIMPEVDRWILSHTFSTLDEYADVLLGSDRIGRFNLNLSGQSLCDDSFLDFVVGQFREISVPPDRITFEITETAAISNLSRAVQFISTFKKMGCRFALDDFGSGLSSFGYLNTLPVDYIKIDGNFVCNIMENPLNYAMIQAINNIGHVMGLKTIAEFVENEDILARLRECRIDYAQGYHFGVPAPIDVLLTHLRA
ncbi:MAG TPA: EAL domain-containing protein [Gammaproteobacteria bacterium]|nr:EAL domain-containing protein [Gammaproteobacteria bacterium]